MSRIVSVRGENGLRGIAKRCVNFHTLDNTDTGLHFIFTCGTLTGRKKSESRGSCREIERDEILH